MDIKSRRKSFTFLPFLASLLMLVCASASVGKTLFEEDFDKGIDKKVWNPHESWKVVDGALDWVAPDAWCVGYTVFYKERKMNTQFLSIPLILSQGCASQFESNLTLLELRCEYAVNPLGIDIAQPRFIWELSSSQRGQMQSAYQILVASSEEKLNANIGDKWDSGKVASDKSVNVAYEGSTLTSGEKCYWKVRCWDKDDKVNGYSKPATFEMGLLKQSDWEGKWIGADISISSPLLRKEFDITKKVKRAMTYISGVGWYELFINGEKVGDHVLDPATTDYAKRVLYVTYDVTNLLNEGPNAVGVMLGNGWYSEPGWERQYGDSPRLLMQMNIKFTDGRAADGLRPDTTSILTDETWKFSSSPITRNDLYGGETYDARLEKPGWTKADYDDSGWTNAVIKESPGGKMVSQLMPAIKVNKTIKPVKLTNPQPGVYVYDMGQLFGGWTSLRVKGPKGAQVTIKYADRISKESGLVDQEHWLRHHPSPETDFYILKGDPQGEVYEPRFTYHPVRYVQIEGYPGEPTLENLEGRVVYSQVDMSGDFHCSNSLLNQIHQNVVWTLTNGLFGIPLDCLHREHWAWTDPATVAGSLYPRKQMPPFWTKWLNDIKDAQRDDGAVPDIAPSYPTDRSDPAWGGNYPILVWYLYQYYEDNRILQEHYDSMKRWLDYLASIADNYILEVSIPVNSPAKVSVPKIRLENVTIAESGKTIWKDGSYVGGVAGITDGSENVDYVTFDVGSGSYSFKLSGTPQKARDRV